MKSLLADRIVIICSVLIVAGLAGFFWALGQFRRIKSSKEFDDAFLPITPPASDFDFRAPAMSTPSSSFAPSTGPTVVSKDVSAKLDTMTQRLAEMQTVLQKQSSGGSLGGAASGGVGQGFSPETIDKLLKIIGNVIQQVDVLQKSLNVSKDAGTPASSPEIANPMSTITPGGGPFTKL